MAPAAAKAGAAAVSISVSAAIIVVVRIPSSTAPEGARNYDQARIRAIRERAMLGADFSMEPRDARAASRPACVSLQDGSRRGGGAAALAEPRRNRIDR